MKTAFKLTLCAALLAGAGLVTAMPGMGSGDPMMGPGGMGCMTQGKKGQRDPARMQARMEQHHAALKVKLALTPAQEPAWTAFTASMKPAAGMAPIARPDPADMAKLTTPERLDKMKALHEQRTAQHTAMMDKHTQAIKTFYATLAPEQQKTFDAFPMMGSARAGMRHGGGMGPGKGPVPTAPQS